MMKWKQSYYNLFFDAGETRVGYNPNTGQFLQFDGAEDYNLARELLQRSPNGQLSADKTQMQKQLIEAGFLIPDSHDELEEIMGRYSQLADKKEVILTVSLTQDCNFDCIYCFEEHLPGTGMSDDVKEKLLNFIEYRTRGMDALIIDWYGGEPLLELELLKEMEQRVMAICEKNGCSYTSGISTNGYLLTPDVVDQLVATTNVSSVRICLDGPPDIHDRYRIDSNGGGTFDVIMKNLHYIVKHLTVKLRINIDKGNWQSLEKLLSILDEKNLNAPNLKVSVKRIYSSRLRPREESFTPQEYSKVAPTLKREVMIRGYQLDGKPEKSCSHCVVASPNQFMVDWRGKLYKCSDNFNPADAVGSIEAFGQAVIDEERLATWLTFPGTNDEQCRRCKALPLCMGGCNFNRFAVANNWCGAERYNLKEYAKLRYMQQKQTIIPLNVVA